MNYYLEYSTKRRINCFVTLDIVKLPTERYMDVDLRLTRFDNVFHSFKLNKTRPTSEV